MAYHRPLIHLKQFRELEQYVGKSVVWKPRAITLKENKGDSNQDYKKIYKRWLTLWNERKPVEDFIRESLKLDDRQTLSSHSFSPQHSPQLSPQSINQQSPDTATIFSSPSNSQPQHSPQSINSPQLQSPAQSQRSPDTATIFSPPSNSQPQSQSRNSYRTPFRNRPSVLNDHPTNTRTYIELLNEQTQNGPPSYYYLEDFSPMSLM